MNRQQFIIIALFTAAETYFFNEAWMTRYIMAAFWAILLFRNFRLSYVMGKIVDAIDQHLNRKD